MVEQTLCNARLGRKCRFGQGLMIRQRMGRRAQTCLRPAHDIARIFPMCRNIGHFGRRPLRLLSLIHKRQIISRPGNRVPTPPSVTNTGAADTDPEVPVEWVDFLTSGLYRSDAVRSPPMRPRRSARPRADPAGRDSHGGSGRRLDRVRIDFAPLMGTCYKAQPWPIFARRLGTCTQPGDLPRQDTPPARAGLIAGSGRADRRLGRADRRRGPD